MFKTLPDGVEIYFSWPSRTARIVPNKLIRHGIETRDNAIFALVALMGLIAAVLREPSPTIGLLMGVVAVAAFVERARYLAKLTKVSLEITGAEIDRAYIDERGAAGGVLAIATGVFVTVCASYVFFSDVPMVFAIALMVCGFVITYVGCRILVGNKVTRPAKRHGKRRGAI